MAWSDSIFISRDVVKLEYLSRAFQAAYTGGRAGLETWVGSPVSQIAPALGPQSLSWNQQGETVVMVLGTVSSGEYVNQTSGWLTPTNLGAGVINSYHFNRAALIYPLIPGDTKLIVGHSMGGAIAGLMGRLGVSRGIRVIGIGTPRYADSWAVLESGWAESIYLADPRDIVSETPHYGFGFPFRDWRVPLVEWACTDDGIIFDTPSPSLVGNLAAIASSYGSSYHEISQYIRYFAGVSSNIGGSGMSSRYRVTVRGVFHEQAVINEFWYAPSAGSEDAGCENLANAFSGKWSTQICPRVSDAYSVLQYDVRRMYGAVSVTPATPSLGSTWRWQEQFIKTGTSADGGAISAGTAFPSFVAVGFRKTCGMFRDSSGAAVNGLKAPRGGGRISGPAEVITGASGGNRIVAASLTAWVGALNSLVQIDLDGSAGGPAWFMQIVTYTYAGSPILTGTPPVADWRHATVSGITVNPYLTSQNSRKQRLSNLG